ncbi:uncharacterized protein N7482_003944 [Penicillium canariense]|uniref:Uncharacterized protein n=1 Tax=Penicillium canariense TaxID=189055 RepID=A0A9W9I866_9EURO|nr:uncharacterized protein N7482_003944 [Penicillium canariense]KAJ5168350.1 hypothetical protein N7482_003944 [Penicillium canariense]
MLLNLGLAADAAAAHPNEPCAQPESASAYTSAFSLYALPFLGTLYNRMKLDAPAAPAGSISAVAMSPVASTPEGQSSTAAPSAPPALARPQTNRSYTNKKPSRPKTAYQFAYPATHARHKRLRLRPKLLLQVQQVSQTPRPLPIIDVLPSTMYLPRLARKFPTLFRQKNGLCPFDVIIVMSELYARTVDATPEKRAGSDDDDEDQREVVATVCQMLQEEARLKRKAEICLNFGPVWEATPLPSGSYEFVARTDDGLRVMRWALRGGKNRRLSAPPGTQAPDDTKRFTFSVIDPNTRRHPVLASMTKNQLEVYDEYSTVTRSTTGHTTPSSAMSVVSDMSDTETPVDIHDAITLDDGLRTLIIVTGIWVAFREGWSRNFSYEDLVPTPNGKALLSPTSSTKSGLLTPTKSENGRSVDRDELEPAKEFADGKRCLSLSSMKRANSMAPAEGGQGSGSISKRSNSTGAAFMERAQRRGASGVNNRLNRHSIFTSTGENGRDIVVSRPSSLRQNSIEPEVSPQRPERPKNKINAHPVADIPKLSIQPDYGPEYSLGSTSDVPSKDSDAEKGKRRHRLGSLFTIFHRKHGAH